MKIAFIVDTFPCISETFVLNQITGLIDLGHDVTVFAGKKSEIKRVPVEVEKYKLLDKTFCINDKPQAMAARYRDFLAYLFRDPVFTIRTMNVFKYGREALSLNVFYKALNFKKTGEFDIVQCHFGTNGNTGALLKEAGFDFKLVTMFHGYDIRRGLAQGKTVYRKLRKYGDCFLSISNYNSNNLKYLGFDERKIIYHPVGIDLDKIGFSTRNMSGKNNDTIKILTVARLVEEKGLEYGIRAFYLVKQQFPDLNFEYTIAGEGPLMDALKEIVANLGLEDDVELCGACSHEEVISLLQECHIFLLPSIAEALPVSLLEAQAAGMPVVASNVGSVYQALVEGESGYMSKPKDISDIAKKIDKLIRNQAKWPHMSISGRKFIEEDYDIKKLNVKLETIYRELLGTGNEK